jgi:tetratricopeptide (TPR) repeat protein
VPPIIVVPPPIILAGNRVDAEGNNPALAFENLPRPIEPLPRGARPGDFLVISPKGGALAPGQIVPEVARVAAVARPPVPAFRFDPFAKRVTVEVEKPDPDPAREATRLVNVGRIAFAAGEYGKAAEQFDRAIAADPKAAVPHFLKAQSAFAAGRYTDAVAAIRAGLALDPDWPTGTFDPKEPYGTNVAAFAAHIAELRKVAAAAPGEATLEFLLGYELWFVGEKVEARKWFNAAAKRLTVPGPIALFK